MIRFPFRATALAASTAMLAASTAVAQDTCSTAAPIGNGVTAFDNSAAMDEGPSFACGFGPAFDLWYAYTAVLDGTLNVETCGSGFDTRIEIYDDCMGDELDCNDDSCGLQSALSIGVTGGATYYIRVAGWNGDTGMGMLTVDGPAIPDECAGADPIFANSPVAFDTTIATPSADAWDCTGNTSNDLWYSFIAPADFMATATTCGLANYDTRLEVFEGTCGALVSLDCNDDACGTRSEVNWMATMGTEYFVRVGGFNAGAQGQGELLLLGPPPVLPNDDCIGAFDLLNGIPEMFDNTLATSNAGAPAWACGGSSSAALDLWYTFTPLADGSVTVDTEGSTGDTRLSVYEGTCGGLALIECNDDGGTGLLSSITFAGVGGTTYFARVAGFGDDVIDMGFMNASFQDTLANDDCANATPVGLGTTSYSNVGATDSGVDMSCVTNGEVSDVWFSFTAANSCPITIDFSGSSFDTGAAAYEGDCGSLVEVNCNDDGGAGLTSFLSFDAVAGTTYLIQAGGFNGAQGAGTFEIVENVGIGVDICMGEPNSTGVGASLKLNGSTAAADNDLTISVTELPLDSMGYVVTSSETNLVMNPGGSAGNLCIASFDMGRFAGNVLDSGSAGAVSFSPDLTD
ncbi:MAG: hypothetical protein AAGB93_20585, partial [Planctomycetota bacterium]